MLKLLIASIAALFGFLSTVGASLEVQKTVAVGGTVTLPCHTALPKSVDWQYHSSPFDAPFFVYSNNLMYFDKVPKRYNVTRPQSGDYSLTIRDAVVGDTGLYTCTEDNGVGVRHTVALLVTASPTAAPPTAEPSSASSAVLIVVVVLLLVVTAAAVILGVCLCKERRRSRPKEETHEVVTLQPAANNGSPGDGVEQQRPLLDESAVSHQDHNADAAGGPQSGTPTARPSGASDQQPVEPAVEPAVAPLPAPVQPSAAAAAAPHASPVYTIAECTDPGKEVRGVCILGTSLYVARSQQTEIDIYDAKTMKKQNDKLDLKKPYPGCMALCPQNKCLYVTYYHSLRIERINLDKSPGMTWSVHSKPDGISATPNASVVVALREVNELVEFSSVGAELLRISLPFADPRHPMPFGDGYLVCCGVIHQTTCGVRLVDKSGKEKKRVDSHTTHPLHLAVDNRGCVLVPCFKDKKVTVLDKDLNYVGCAISEHEIKVDVPFRLCFDEKFERLYVGEFEGNCRVLAFNIS